MNNNCPSGLSRIRWRYPNEDWQEIEGDNYTTELIKEELPNDGFVYWEAEVVWKYLPSDSLYTETYTAHDLRFGSYNNHGLPRGRPLFDEVKSSKAELLIPYEARLSDESTRKTYYNLYVSRSYRPYSWTFSNICVVSTSDATSCDSDTPENSQNCKLTVLKNAVIVHEEIQEVCPEVEKYCQQDCPNWTCKCIQGNRVCCYDPNGRVVKSFLL